MPNRLFPLRRATKQGGFTLIELLIVVIILAILAAVVIPQFSDSTKSAKEAALDANLATMRSAIDLYYQQHGDYPGIKAANGGSVPTGATGGTGTAGTAQAVVDQLTMFSNAQGQTSTIADSNFKFGPYLKKGIPAEPVSGSAVIELSTVGALGMSATSGTSVGWKFDNKTGQLIANSTAYQSR